MAVTRELLDALLSPGGGATAEAEAHLSSLSTSDRIAGLVGILLEGGRDPSSAGSWAPRATLAAVLLRRDLASLAGVGGGAAGAPSQAMSMADELVGPLLGLFLEATDAATAGVRRQVGHCLAELCLSASVLETAEAGAGPGRVMTTVLNGIGPGVSECGVRSELEGNAHLAHLSVISSCCASYQQSLTHVIPIAPFPHSALRPTLPPCSYSRTWPSAPP